MQLPAAFAAGRGIAQPSSYAVHVGVSAEGGIARTADASRYASFLRRFWAFLLDQFMAGALAVTTYLIMAALTVFRTFQLPYRIWRGVQKQRRSRRRVPFSDPWWIPGTCSLRLLLR